MSKKLGSLGVVIGATVLVVGVVTPAVGSADNSSGRRDIRLDSTVTEVRFVDVAPGGPSLGDEIVFSEKLMNRGVQVGHEGAVCTTVSLARQEAECTATFSLSRGQVTAEGLVILGSKTPYAVAITGGTGKYQGAAGEVRVTPISGTQGLQNLHLTRS